MNPYKAFNMQNAEIVMRNQEEVFDHLIVESPRMYLSLRLVLDGLGLFTQGVMYKMQNGIECNQEKEAFFNMCDDVDKVCSKALCLCLLTGLDINLEESA